MMRRSKSIRRWSPVASGAAVALATLLTGCALLTPGALVNRAASEAPAESEASEPATDERAQEQFFDNVMLAAPTIASFDPTSSWATVEPLAWGDADPSLREMIVEMGEDACARADEAESESDLEDPMTTWFAARFLCTEHREAADEFLSNGVSVSPTHSMADLFELAVIKEDATVDDLITANDYCIGALAIAWEVHEQLTPDITCWLIRVQSVEETGGDSEYVSLFRSENGSEDAAKDARFSELAEASLATPSDLSELLEGVE